ncbi:DNA repair protein RecN [Nakamurella flavida]|uniref:DNA repair protein RecN n=1 Tax=Nakamurella flavida TaxID=363630 RepID=A0A938YSU6_9ACTN|nr:DNA repair protein RecN [Nakamurella flavida]MBM9478240.1 DNA repair protein RecN [Nakamurella flavida]MDP9777590.1 DNA repair protein RecN (Recombination protein N) [Nakamurella flavida]
MLAELRITGLGVIDEAVLEPSRGFTAVTGETGAGKTMVVTALSLIGAARADAARVRAGADRAVVEARFTLPPGGTIEHTVTAAGGSLDDDGSVIAVRSVSADGRSRAHVGGRAAPLAVLAELTGSLLAVHGQSEAIGLLRGSNQRAVLDRYAGLHDLLVRYRAARDRWQAAVADLADRRTRARELAQREQVLRLGVQEIQAVAPLPGEDVDLLAEVRRRENVDDLRAAAQQALTALAGADTLTDAPTAVGLVETARHAVLAATDERLSALGAQLHEASAVLADASAELSAYLDGLDSDPAELEQLLSRQAALKTLTRRYGEDVDAVLAWSREAEAELTGLDSSEEALAQLAAEAQRLADEVAVLAAEVSAGRSAAAATLGAAVTDELAALAMGRASVRVAVTRRVWEEPTPPAAGTDTPARTTAAARAATSTRASTPARSGARERAVVRPVDVLQVEGAWVQAGASGIDTVEIVMTAHPGAPELPINKGASGGELSRVMLALEAVLAGSDPVDTLVFDEVDAGVGGRAATEIGRRLADLARDHQVIVVTHLAQVAAFADRHFVVEPGEGGTIGSSSVRQVADADRDSELARMLGGTDSPTARAHAADLLAATREPTRRPART